MFLSSEQQQKRLFLTKWLAEKCVFYTWGRRRVETCILGSPSSFPAFWLAVAPHPAADGQACLRRYFKVRQDAESGSQRLFFLSQLGKKLLKLAVIRHDRQKWAQDCSRQTRSGFGKFLQVGGQFLAHFKTETHNERVQLFYRLSTKPWASNNSAESRQWLKHPF